MEARDNMEARAYLFPSMRVLPSFEVGSGFCFWRKYDEEDRTDHRRGHRRDQGKGMGGGGVNITKRSTLRRWIDEAWMRNKWSMQDYFGARFSDKQLHLYHQAKRWARFAVACEVELKRVDLK